MTEVNRPRDHLWPSTSPHIQQGEVVTVGSSPAPGTGEAIALDHENSSDGETGAGNCRKQQGRYHQRPGH